MATKARAYAEEARADYDAYVASGDAQEPFLDEHHRLQLLQMALEKLAKAFLYYAEPNARYSHNVVKPALNRLRSRTVAEAVGKKYAEFDRMLTGTKSIFLQIEAASPSVGNDGRDLTREQSERTANVEYPWQADEHDDTSWIAPVSHSFPIMKTLRRDWRTRMAVDLLDRLIRAAETILPSS